MIRLFIVGALLLVIPVFLAVAGCEKEKIVETTEYVHDTEYVQLPPDTVFQIDTVFVSDSVTIYDTDTVFLFDTVVQTEYVYDTVTTVIIDTVLTTQCTPNEFLALAALQYYCDPLVLDLINTEFGIADGWIFYLSAFQLDLTRQSSGVYDIYGYIDYWTTDWTGFYPLEFYWRLVYSGGDPADPGNWQMSEPPDPAPDHRPGIRVVQDPSRAEPTLR